jgi:dihydroneopterin aldolase
MHGPSVKLIEHLAFLIGNKISELVDKDSYFEITVRKLNPRFPSELDYSEVTLIWPR